MFWIVFTKSAVFANTQGVIGPFDTQDAASVYIREQRIEGGVYVSDQEPD
jgi:hypothetical protein